MKESTRIRDEEGSVIVLSMVLLVFLTVLGLAATRTSSIEVQIASNDRHAVQNLYKAEAGDHYALEIGNTWMTDTFLTTDETTASYTGDDIDLDSDTEADVDIDIRCIQNTNAAQANANNLPLDQHIAPPPVGSGYSLGDFEIRRYGITATSIRGNSQVQIGAYKVFNRY